MTLAHLRVRISDSWPEMMRRANMILEERGMDASAIISVALDAGWLLVFYREETKIIKAKDLKANDVLITDHGHRFKINEVRASGGMVIVRFPSDDSWSRYHPESDVRIV